MRKRRRGPRMGGPRIGRRRRQPWWFMPVVLAGIGLAVLLLSSLFYNGPA